MFQRLGVLSLPFLLAVGGLGCRDLNLPPTPGPGSIQGTVAYVKAGRPTPIPAGGAIVELTRQGRTARASDATGFFRFDGITNDEGSLLFKFVEPESNLVFQRSVRLSEISAGFGHDVQLGTLVLGPTASVSGKVLRKDLSSPSGHGGTLVFVPEGPALTQTADDGSYTLPGLPEGTFTLSMFRAGYLGQSVSGALRSAEEFRVATVVLEVDPAMPMPATVKGRVLMLDGSEPSGVTVSFEGDPGTQTATTGGDGTFSRDGLEVGLYQLTFAKSGFRTVTVHNVLATGVVDVGSITLVPAAQAGPELDAGTQPVPDAGPDDGGTMGGDGGAGDGGAGDGGTGDGGAGDGGLTPDAGTDAGVDAGFPPGMTVLVGNNQTVFPVQDLAPVRFAARDDAGQPLAAVDLVLVGGPAGGALQQGVLSTDSNGEAVADFVAPRTLGTHQFLVQQVDGGGPLGVVTFTVVPPDAGVAYTLINRGLTQLSATDGGVAALSGASSPRGLAVASDGTVYFTSFQAHQVFAISPAGVVTAIAGVESQYGYTGNGGPATSALLEVPHGLALDEANRKLYLSELNNHVVRVINLATGAIDYLGGRGNATDADFGDNGSFSNAKLAGPGALAFRVEGGVPMLYVADVGHDRLRKVNLSTNLITTVLKPTGKVGEFAGCGSTTACSIAWLPNGERLVSGNVMLANFTISGLLRLSPSGAMTPLSATGDSADTVDGVAIYNTNFSGAPAIAVNQAGDVFLSDEGHHTIRRIEAGTGLVTTPLGVVNDPAPTPNFRPGTQTSLANPAFLAFGPDGTLYVADQNHHAIRAVAGLDRATRTPSSIGTDAGTTFSAPVLQTASSPALVRVTANGQPLGGLEVRFTGLSDGGFVSPAAITDLGGVAGTAIQSGLTVGTYQFAASFTDPLGFPAANNPVTFTINTTAPPAGTLLTVVNRDHQSAVAGIPGPAPFAHLQAPWALAVGPDGSIYVSDVVAHSVEVVRPGGLVEHLAGNGFAGYSGDNGPAANARFDTPRGLAIDSLGHYLYVADTGNDVVRRIDLTANPPVVQAFAGWLNRGGTPNDGASAGLAGLDAPSHLLVRTELGTEWLYVADYNHGRIARLKTDGTLTETFFSPAIGPTTGIVPFTTMCSYNNYQSECGFAFDSMGRFILAAEFVHPTENYQYMVVRWDQQANSLTRLTGSATAATGEGVPAVDVQMPEGPVPLFAPNGDLLLVIPTQHRMRAIDASGNMNTVVGDSTPGFVGDYVSISAATRFQYPRDVAVWRGHLVIADTGNSCVRLIW